MRIALLVLTDQLAACEQPDLEDGRWTGALTPMNHPEMSNPVFYGVRHDDRALAIDLISPDGESVSTREPRLEGDTCLSPSRSRSSRSPCSVRSDMTEHTGSPVGARTRAAGAFHDEASQETPTAPFFR